MTQARPEQLTLSNWDLGGPVSVWSYSHADQLFPVVRLSPGRATTPMVCTTASVPEAVRDELESELVESAVVLVAGEAVYRGPSADQPRLLMSVSKVIASLIIGILADRGEVGYDQPVRGYLSRLGPQWDRCRLIDVLDMASGVVCPEVGDPGAYLDPSHPFFQFEASFGWRPATRADPLLTLLPAMTGLVSLAGNSPIPRSTPSCWRG